MVVARRLVIVLFAAIALQVAAVGPVLAQSRPTQGEVVLGEEEQVVLRKDGKSIDVLAKTDTGAGYSSIDDDLAEELGFDLEDPPDEITIRSSLGEETRPLVPVDLQMAGREVKTRVTVTDRDDLSNDMLIGSRDLEGYLVRTGEEQLTSPNSAGVEAPVASLLEFPPPPPAAPTLLAAMPLAAALIVAARVLVGLQTFGVFAPVLLSIALVQTGIPAGLFVFGTMIVAGLLAQLALRPLMLPRVARLAVVLSLGAGILLAVSHFVADPSVSSAWATAFPIVVVSVVIERFWEMWEQEGFGEASKTGFLTLVIAMLACPLLVASPVRWLSAEMPVVPVVAGAAVCVLLGRYRGLRLSELVRFRPAANGAERS